MITLPTLRMVFEARRRIAPYLSRTPLAVAPALSERLGCELYLKCEFVQPIRAFKVRGGINLVSAIDCGEAEEPRPTGFVTASTGNHGQSIAYAARLFGYPAFIFAPEGSNPDKVSAMKRLGATVEIVGRDVDAALAESLAFAARGGYRFVHPANEPLLIAGVATAYLEVVEELPDADVIMMPVGGGTGSSGACVSAKAVSPKLRVIGVQSEGAPPAYLSWKTGQLQGIERVETIAEGMAVRHAYELPFRILREGLDDFLLVSEEEISSAIVEMLSYGHFLVEGASAAPLAAAHKIRDQLQGKKVVLMLTGSNMNMAVLRRILGEC